MKRQDMNVLAVIWEWPSDSKHAGIRFCGCHNIASDGRLADWPQQPLGLIPRGAAKITVTEGEGLDLIEQARALRANGELTGDLKEG